MGAVTEEGRKGWRRRLWSAKKPSERQADAGAHTLAAGTGTIGCGPAWRLIDDGTQTSGTQQLGKDCPPPAFGHYRRQISGPQWAGTLPAAALPFAVRQAAAPSVVGRTGRVGLDDALFREGRSRRASSALWMIHCAPAARHERKADLCRRGPDTGLEAVRCSTRSVTTTGPSSDRELAWVERALCSLNLEEICAVRRGL